MRVNQIHNRFRTQVLRGDLDVCEKRNVIFSHLSSQTPRIVSPFSGPHIKNPSSGTSLVAQGVRLHAPSAEGLGLIQHVTIKIQPAAPKELACHN
jgi:hypothetical protein